MTPDPYDVLGVARDATQDEINSAYRRLVRRHHPDSRPDGPSGSSASSAADEPAELERVLAAYTILRDPARRAEYDRRHAPQSSGPQPSQVPPEPPAPPAPLGRDRRTRMTIRVSPVRYHGPPSKSP